MIVVIVTRYNEVSAAADAIVAVGGAGPQSAGTVWQIQSTCRQSSGWTVNVVP